MGSNYERDRIEQITEQDFWSSFRKVPALADAVSAGLAGKRAKAYELIGKHHAQSLASEREAYGQSVEKLRGSDAQLATIRERADMVLRHEIQGWHTQVIKFGRRIDFNADFGASGQYGFHYLGWLVPVLQQYALTGETKYRDCFIDVIRQYYEQRTTLVRRIPRLHPVYYELGAWAKAKIILPAYALLVAEEGTLSTDMREAMLKLLLGFGRAQLRHQKGGFRHGNWQIVGCAALFMIGAALPELAESTRWRRCAEDILLEHAKRDFFSDGGHSERCWGYGYMSLGGMRTYYETALRHDRLAPAKKGYWTRFLKRAFQWYAAATTPSRDQLNFGDGGIGSAQGILDEGAAMFPELAAQPGVLGVDRSRSNILKPSGYAFMRDGDDADAPFMAINFGKWGGGHTHADLLDFSLWRWGRPIIDEVGRFGSYDNPLDPMFRSPESHNQVVLDCQVMNRSSVQGEDVQWQVHDGVDFFSAWHQAYQTPRIHRQIAFIKPDCWLVYDVVSTVGEYIFQCSHYLHAPGAFAVTEEGTAVTRDPDADTGCVVTFANPADVRRMIAGVDYTRDDFGPLVKPGGKANQRHHLRTMKWHNIGESDPITFACLLVPFRGKRQPQAKLVSVRVTGDASGQAAAFDITLGKTTTRVICNPQGADIRCGNKAVTETMAAKVGGTWIAMA